MVDIPERVVGRVITAVPLSGSDIESWFRTFREVHDKFAEADEQLDEFPRILESEAENEGLRSQGESFKEFFGSADGIDEYVLRKVVELGDQLSDIYRELSPFTWLTDDQWDEFESMWSAEWPQILNERLEEHWSETWQTEFSDDNKAEWMEGLLPTLVLGGDVADYEEENHEEQGETEEPVAEAEEPQEPEEQAGELAKQVAEAAKIAWMKVLREMPGATIDNDEFTALINARMKAAAQKTEV